MKVGIIGAGNIGSTLTRRLTALGHEVAVANSRGPETLDALARETGAKAATPTEAAKGKDLVIVTIPEKSVLDLPRLFDEADSTVIVDTCNYYPRERDGFIKGIEAGEAESALRLALLAGWRRRQRQ